MACVVIAMPLYESRKRCVLRICLMWYTAAKSIEGAGPAYKQEHQDNALKFSSLGVVFVECR